ncbi:MAG: sugar-binding transcriptional regulator [Formosimonas sp.]
MDDAKLELQAQIAWLYYIGNLTQQEIAKKVGLSRPTVQRFLNLAVESGIVQVKIDHTSSLCMDLARRLKAQYGLRECEVAPVEDETVGQIDRLIAMTSARFLEQTLRTPSIKGIALGTGRAISAMCQGVSRALLTDFKVVSLAGTVAADGSFNRYDASLSLAAKTDGKYYILSIPLFAQDEQDRAYWYASRTYVRQLSHYNECHLALIGVGWLGRNCSLVQDGFVSEQVMDELVAQGAVCDVLGWILDAQGQPLAHAMNQCITSFRPEVLKKRPVIGVAGGERKHAAIHAALQGGWLTGLITDQRTAEYLLRQVS